VNAEQVDYLPKEDRNLQKTVPTQTPFSERQTKPLKDPLIAWGWEKVVYALVLAIITGSVILLGVINKKLEYAIAFALLISAIAFVLFFF
jgi:hypothetical protein